MFKKLSRAFTLGAMVFGTTALAAGQQTIDVRDALTNSKLPAKQRAKTLVEAGEKLMVPAGLIYADSLFNAAISIDPGNRRAIFYHRLLAPARVFAGYHKRIENLVLTKGGKRAQKSHRKEIAGLPEGGLLDFYRKGEKTYQPFRNEADMQQVLDSALQKMDNLRVWIKANKDLKIGIPYVTEIAINPETNKKYKFKALGAKCNVKQLSGGVFKIDPCDLYKQHRLKVDRTDWELIQQMTAAYEILTIFANAYDLTGSLDISKKNSEREEKAERESKRVSLMTDQEIYQFLKGKSKFGKLRSQNQMTRVPDLAADVYAGVKWAKKFEQELCHIETQTYYWQGSNGVQQSYSYSDQVGIERPGHLVPTGTCQFYQQDDLYQDFAEKAELALSGSSYLDRREYAKHSKPIVETRTPYGPNTVWVQPQTTAENVQREFKVNALAPFRKPPKNLKEFLPSEFNECGDPTGGHGPTIGGALPEGDGHEFMIAIGSIDTGRNAFCGYEGERWGYIEEKKNP